MPLCSPADRWLKGLFARWEGLYATTRRLMSPISGSTSSWWNNLTRILGTNIDSIHVSDHPPITLDLSLGVAPRDPFQWKLNETLLQDSVTMSEIKSKLSHYFSMNTSPEVTLVLVWKTHKPVIRGIFMKHGARLKRARENQVRELLVKIHRLEVAHKNLADAASLSELSVARTVQVPFCYIKPKASCRNV